MIRVLVADDHPVVREGIKRIVATSADMQVVAEAGNGDEVLAHCRRGKVDVALLDLSMPGLGLGEILRQLGAAVPTVRVLILSVHPEDQYAVRAFKAGAVGYLTKDHAPAELLMAIRRAWGGGRYVSPALAEKLARSLAPGVAAFPHETLSERELAVLLGLAAGKAIKLIATDLGLSPKTVTTYRSRVLRKLGLRCNADLVRYALRQRLLPLAQEPDRL